MHQYLTCSIDTHIETLCIAIHRCITVLSHLYSGIAISNLGILNLIKSCLESQISFYYYEIRIIWNESLHKIPKIQNLVCYFTS